MSVLGFLFLWLGPVNTHLDYIFMKFHVYLPRDIFKFKIILPFVLQEEESPNSEGSDFYDDETGPVEALHQASS